MRKTVRCQEDCYCRAIKKKSSSLKQRLGHARKGTFVLAAIRNLKHQQRYGCPW